MKNPMISAARRSRAAALLALSGALALACFGTTANAQADREGMWEMGGTLLDLSSVNLSRPNGTSVYVDDETGWGFTAAYNFSNRFSLGGDITWADPQYAATVVPDSANPPEKIQGNLDVNVIHLKATINLLDNDFTPYVEFGGGWTYLDSNVVESISVPGCFWDPWWGYYCPAYANTYSDTRTSISYAVGVRWDMDNDMVLKAAWGEVDIDTSGGEDIKLDSIQLTVAWKF